MRRISFARKECAVRMIAPTLKAFFDRRIAIRKGWRTRSSSALISSSGMRNGGTSAKRSPPLDGAAHRGHDLRQARLAALQHGVQHLPQVAPRHARLVLPVVV